MRKNATRFLLVGVGAFIIDYGLTLLLHYGLDITGYVASAISFTTSFVFSFSLSRHWVFRPKATYKLSGKRQLILYLSLAAVNLGISTAMVAALSIANVDVYLSKALAIAVIASWNFVISHFIIFAEKKELSEN